MRARGDFRVPALAGYQRVCCERALQKENAHFYRDSGEQELPEGRDRSVSVRQPVNSKKGPKIRSKIHCQDQKIKNHHQSHGRGRDK